MLQQLKSAVGTCVLAAEIVKPRLGCGIASTISWSSWVSSDASTGTIAYAVAHPTTFITASDWRSDWYYTNTSSSDDTRWQTSDKTKGIYDPCPPGWRVPDGGIYGVWSTAFGSTSPSSYPLDLTNKGMNFGSGNSKALSSQLGERIYNLQDDWHWKLCHKLCRQYAVLCIEDLNIEGLKRI